MNLRPAPESVILAIKRRLDQPPGGGVQLVTDSVKLCALPGLPFDCTTFIVVRSGKGQSGSDRHFVCELARPDLPHIYQPHALPPNGEAKLVAEVMVRAIAGLAKTIATDPRFRRRVVPVTLNSGKLNGFARRPKLPSPNSKLL